MSALRSKAEGDPGPAPARAVDQHVGARMRERRIMLGLSQQQLAELIGVTYQQANKYERGINRISAGRLSRIATALGVDVEYLFDGLAEGSGKPRQQNNFLDLARSFNALPSRRHQEAICDLARAMADPILPDSA